jgi:hypothetical protein
MKVLFIIGLLLFSTISIDVYGANPADWQLEKQTKHVSIYTRDKPNSKFLQVKAEVTLSANWTKVIAQFSDENKCWDWQGRCSSVNIIKKINESDRLMYTVIDMPWPVSNRDFLFYAALSFNSATKVTNLTLTPAEDVDYPSGLVRAKSNIHYVITPMSEELTQLNILMHTEFGGDITASFVNSKLVDELFIDIEELTSLIMVK